MARFIKFISSTALGISLLFIIFLAYGCAAEKRSAEKIDLLAEGTVTTPVKATGNCKLFYTNEKGEKTVESFPIRLWYLKNDKFCFYGDVVFDSKGAGFAIDEGKYWIYAKPLKMFEAGDITDAINTKFYIEAQDYKTVGGSNFSFPQKLVYHFAKKSKDKHFLEIKLDSVKLWQPRPEQVEILFTPPDANEIKKNGK